MKKMLLTVLLLVGYASIASAQQDWDRSRNALVFSVFGSWADGESLDSPSDWFVSAGGYWSPLQFTFVGLEIRPQVYLFNDATDDDMDRASSFFSVSPMIGFVIPIPPPRGRIFGSALIDIGNFEDVGRHGLITAWAAPGFSTGLELAISSFLMFNVSYRHVWFRDTSIHSAGVGLGFNRDGATRSMTRNAIASDAENNRNRLFNDAARLWSLGLSVATTLAASSSKTVAFTEPKLIVSPRITIAPLRHAFLRLGWDFGFIGDANGVGYYSMYPFAHLAFYRPFNAQFGFYIGGGGGLMLARYRFYDLVVHETIPAADFTGGFILGNIIDISYTFRTNFSTHSHIVSFGFTWRLQCRG